MPTPPPFNSVTLDPRFITTSDVDTYYVDKDLGTPLAAGIWTSYSETDRITLKPVYQLSGTPGNYTYTPLPNPSTLSSVGTFQDALGNNIVPYYFPYEGTPADSSGQVELYYITVQSAGNILQLTRIAWPNGAAASTTTTGDSQNFIPNGQFLAHTQIVGSNQPPFSTLGARSIQPIAQGGWSFQRSVGGVSTFNNSFSRISTGISGLDDFPRYAFNFICTNFDPSDTVRDLVIEWPDVNKFSSGNPPGDQDYTLFLAGQSSDSNSYIFEVVLIRYYGTGGAPTPIQETNLGTITFSPSYGYKTIRVQFPANAGTLGTNNDDFCALAIRGPSSPWAIQTTDWALLFGDVDPDFFPEQTNANMLSIGVAGWMPTPNPDGSDLYLTLQLTPEGMRWNTGEIGNIVACSNLSTFTNSISTITNLLICDGSSYITEKYSPLGIPYSRLQSYLWDSTQVMPITGTGLDYVSTYIPSNNTAVLRIATNESGAQTATADGVSGTGFTFATLYTGNANYGLNAYVTRTAGLLIVTGKVIGAVTAPTAGTSGFTITSIYNSSNTQQLFSILVGSLPGAGSYFTFSNTVPTNYYVWFTIDGGGADPAPGGTGILVPLLSTYSLADAISLIREALSGYQGSSVTTIAAAGITGGDYFTFNASGALFAPWYKVANVGTAPVVVGTTIEIELTGTETAAQVATATRLALNSYQFAVPNTKDVILSGLNTGFSNIPGDLSYGGRFGLNDTVQASALLSYQFSQNISHDHTYTAPTGTSSGYNQAPGYVGGAPGGACPFVDTFVTDTAFQGGPQANPFNMSVLYAIKY